LNIAFDKMIVQRKTKNNLISLLLNS